MQAANCQALSRIARRRAWLQQQNQKVSREKGLGWNKYRSEVYKHQEGSQSQQRSVTIWAVMYEVVTIVTHSVL